MSHKMEGFCPPHGFELRIHRNKKYVVVEQWSLNGKTYPLARSTTTVPLSATETSLARYTLPCPQSFYSMPLLPRADSVVPPDAVALRLDGSLLRLGSKMFGKTRTNNLSSEAGFREITDMPTGDSWEEVCLREPFLVVEECQPSPTVSGWFFAPLGESDDNSSGYFSNSETDSSDSRGLHGISSAEESWSEGISNAEDPSSDEIASQEPSESDNDDTADDQDGMPENSANEDSDIKSSFGMVSDNSQYHESLASLDISEVFDDSHSSSDDLEIDSDVSKDDIHQVETAPTNPEPEGPVTILKPAGRVRCDACNKHCSRQWYHCVKCSNDNFDLCEKCERRGRWCLDLTHQLYRIIMRKAVAVVSRRNFDVKQELTVYRTDAAGDKVAVFHSRKKYPIFLYDSPPIVHQKHDLVVWALSDSCLLFGDLTQNNCFEQKIKTPRLKKAHPICVSLSFSACGNLLRMAVIDAVAEKPKLSEGNTSAANVARARLCLNLHVLVLQISSTQPARYPPKLLGTTSCRLGCSCARAFVPTLPFAFTWSAFDLYLTISDSYLHVYRVLLPKVEMQTTETEEMGQAQKAKTADSVRTKKAPSLFRVLVPQETILLPRSSRNRSVQFFPAKKSDTKATVIIGPRYGRNPAPPIGVYLSDHDLGDWDDLEKMTNREGMVYASEMTLEGQFEEPWEQSDCILVPFDGY
ncbi:hypothetical protein GQ53DRAFT_866803 [Thozetella sp. PMI_491]|nr:hypothetical protein GQ53DRAFT_866803 [Thozetella sp. PMI_491]